MADLSLQNFVIARISEYCDFHDSFDDVNDPILYLWEKLKEIEEPMYKLKQQLLDDSAASFLSRTSRGQLTEDLLADFKQLLESFLAPGDFVDAVFMLEMSAFADPERKKLIEEFLRSAKAGKMLDEEDKPEEKMNKRWRVLVGELYARLAFPLGEQVAARKRMTARRMRFILRRARFNAADYCAVFRFPVNPDDTFTPFILPRVEALVAANQRFLKRLRSAGATGPRTFAG